MMLIMDPQAHKESGELGKLIFALAKNEVDFIICGGLACILHGVSRVTEDIDLAVDMNHDNIEQFIQTVTSLNYVPRIPEPIESLLDESRREAWINEKQAKVFTLTSPDHPLQIDVFLQYPITFDQLAQHASERTMGSVSFRISSREHLIQAKQQVQPPRTTDLRDIEDLLELIHHDEPT